VTLIGRSEKVSVPPTSTAVAVPVMIFSAADVIPMLLEIQAMDTVWAGISLGKPEGKGREGKGRSSFVLLLENDINRE